MTTREEYAEAAHWVATVSTVYKEERDLAARVLRQLAEGAVLCKPEEFGSLTEYWPIEEQP
jgi:hypothetical protein